MRPFCFAEFPRLEAFTCHPNCQGKKAATIANRMHVAVPRPRDSTSRPPVIPPGVLVQRAAAAAATAAGEPTPPPRPRPPTEKDLEQQFGGAGVYSSDLRKTYLLEDDSWKYDIMPEILDGHNVMDFVDPEVEERLAQLEAEEEVLERQFAEAIVAGQEASSSDLGSEDMELVEKIRTRRKEVGFFALGSCYAIGQALLSMYMCMGMLGEGVQLTD